MVSEVFSVCWHPEAFSELKAIYSYYAKRSVQGAGNLRDDILKTIDKLAHTSSLVNYPYDRILKAPFRSVQIRRFKIVHTKESDKYEIKILGIFDTKQFPDKISEIKKRQ